MVIWQFLEIQDRFNFRLKFSIIFEKKNNEQIFTSLIVPKNVCDPESEYLTELWTEIKKNGVITKLRIASPK